jgi:Tfp pilus assembly protein PilO
MKAITAIIIVAVSIGMYFMYISPSIADIRMLTEKNTEYISTLSKSKELKDKRDTLLTSYAAISPADLDRLGKIIPNTFDPVAFAKDMNGMASSNGLVLKNMKISTAPKLDSSSQGVVLTAPVPDAYKTIFVTFTVVGTYEQFVQYLKNMEMSIQLTDIISISVKSSDTPIYEYTVDLSTYSLQ